MPPSAEALRDEILRIAFERDLRVIMVTHDLTDAAFMADAALVMRGPTDHQLVMFERAPTNAADRERLLGRGVNVPMDP